MLSGGARHYFASNGRTNVTGLVNSSGTTIEAEYRYRPFGDTETATGTVTNNVRFAGRELDPETGLYYNRARYYDAKLGRFASEDPTRLAGGSEGSQPLEGYPRVEMSARGRANPNNEQ